MWREVSAACAAEMLERGNSITKPVQWKEDMLDEPHFLNTKSAEKKTENTRQCNNPDLCVVPFTWIRINTSSSL